MKKKAIMVVMNTLETDARVQRAAGALGNFLNVTLIGIGNSCGYQKYEQVILTIRAKAGTLRYFEYLRKVKAYLRIHRFDVFYAHDYFSAALVPWVRKHYPDATIIYDSHELIFPAKGFRQSRRDAFFSYFEKKAVRSADLVICASKERANLMRAYYKIEEAPLVIENISQLPIIHDETSSKLLDSAKYVLDNNDIVLVYAGVLSSGRKIESLINIVASRDDTQLLVIGGGPDFERLISIAEQKIRGKYCFTGSIPYKYMGLLLEKCDIGYISYPTDSLNNTYCAPNKIYEYASVGLPMIAPYNPTIKEFFDEFKIGVIDDDLGIAFDKVRESLADYKNNCTKFTSAHQWSQKASELNYAIELSMLKGERKND